MKRLLIQPDFFSEAQALRKSFDQRFADPRSSSRERFVWDYWNIPGQYTLLRTPAWELFPRKLYESFHRKLVLWGREVLGCHDISPPWLSCYVEGCEQNLHGDLPHGPFAFVYSLTRWKQRQFSGGETLLLREPILSFWESQRSGGALGGVGQGMEEADILERVPARFNQLLVFDPRVPHGVSRVEGVRDVRQGRLVVHGWFVQPRPFIQGSLRAGELERLIEALTRRLEPEFASGLSVSGMLSVRFEVSATGAVGAPRVLANTLRSQDPRAVARLVRVVGASLRGGVFKRQRGRSQVTLPLVFE